MWKSPWKTWLLGTRFSGDGSPPAAPPKPGQEGKAFLPHGLLGAPCVSLTWRSRLHKSCVPFPLRPCLPVRLQDLGFDVVQRYFILRLAGGPGTERQEKSSPRPGPLGPPGWVHITSYTDGALVGLSQEKAFLLQVGRGACPCHPLSSPGVAGAGSRTCLCARRPQVPRPDGRPRLHPDKFLRLEHRTWEAACALQACGRPPASPRARGPAPPLRPTLPVRPWPSLPVAGEEQAEPLV